ncbi:MAG: hypothetical protein HC880_02840, partial [Bacteroidia bacterium]|nr:hypothetical protein [Bacteroidia bacterium]
VLQTFASPDVPAQGKVSTDFGKMLWMMVLRSKFDRTITGSTPNPTATCAASDTLPNVAEIAQVCT